MQIHKSLFTAAAAVTLAILAACGGEKAADGGGESGSGAAGGAKPTLEPQDGDSAAMTAAKTRFKTVCSTCHGLTGKGDGAVGASLNPKPRDYSDKAWQESVTDERLAKVILEGGPAVGLSPIMPPNPDLADKPEVVDALVQIVRSFGK